LITIILPRASSLLFDLASVFIEMDLRVFFPPFLYRVAVICFSDRDRHSVLIMFDNRYSLDYFQISDQIRFRIIEIHVFVEESTNWKIIKTALC